MAGSTPWRKRAWALWAVLVLIGFGGAGGQAAPAVSSFKINNGAVTTVNPTVTLPNVCAGASAATHFYMASESPDFAGATWQAYASVPLFPLSSGGGVKTVYFKVKDGAGAESGVTSDTISLVGMGLPVVTWGKNDLSQCTLPTPTSEFFSVAVGWKHNVGLKSDGTIVAWGMNENNQIQVPAPNNGFVAVGAGAYHSLAVKSDGSVVAWGRNTEGQCNVPSPNRGFVAVAAGFYHSIGLKSDGSVVAWGSNLDYNQQYSGQCIVPSPNSGFVAVSAGLVHSLGLKSDGSLVAWGTNKDWQGNDIGLCVVPSPNSGFVAIANGYYDNLALKSDGSIVTWGINVDWERKNVNLGTVPLPNSGFIAIASGPYHHMGLRFDGSITAWGRTAEGQCAFPSPNRGVATVCGGGLYHSVALASEGAAQVNLLPLEVIAAGAQWRLTREAAGVWHNSGETVTARIGSDTLTFKDVYGWNKPTDQPVEFEESRTTTATGTYSRISWPLSTVCTSGTVLISAEGTRFPHGTTLTLTVQPDSGYWFDHWTGDVPVGWERVNPLLLTMDSTKTLTAVLTFGPPPAVPVITAFKINNGAENTANPTVLLANISEETTGGEAVAFLASESPDFTGAVWRPYGSIPMFTLSQGADLKTVYFKAKNAAGEESPVTSDTISLLGAGSLVAWGNYSMYGETTTPSPNRDFVAVGGGSQHTLGLKSDGSVVAWGRKDQGQCTVPSPNSDFVAVGGGLLHSVGLKSDGSIVTWGGNFYGQRDVPSPNSGFVTVSVGQYHTLGLKSDGSIVAWGRNSYGECTVPSPNRGFVAVAAGEDGFSCALRFDGSIVAWGNNGSGQCTVPEPNRDFIGIAAGKTHCLGLKSDGSIVAWGSNSSGQCTVPDPNRGFAAVSAGDSHSLGLKSDGTIVAWGNNSSGQCVIPVSNIGFSACVVEGGHSLALVPSSYRLETPAAQGQILRNPDLAAYPRGTTVTLTAQPGAGSWLDHWMGDVPEGLARVNPLVITMDRNRTISMDLFTGAQPPAPGVSKFSINNGAATTANRTVVLTNSCAGVTSATVAAFMASESADFTTATWQSYTPLSLFTLSGGNGARTVYFKVKDAANAESSVTSDTILLGGEGFPVAAWGSSVLGQCSVPSPNRGFVSISAGERHSLGLKSDGSIVGWGDNTYGQRSLPSPNSGFTAVAAGDIHSLGLKADGSIVMWGIPYGTLPSPNSDFVAVAAGRYHSLGLKADGTIAAWGASGLQDVPSGDYAVQYAVPSPNRDFVALAAGIYHSLGLKSDGSIVAWGYNGEGQCTVPEPNSGFVAIAAGAFHSLGLKSDGSIVVWGRNTSGQLDVPPPNRDFISVEGGSQCSLGLKTDGTVVTWGGTALASIPAPNSGFTAIAVGDAHALALAIQGDLQVALTPPEAVAAGARWRLTDEAQDVWHDTTVYDPVTKTVSRTTLRSRVGTHTLTFKGVYGWTKPANQSVELTTTATAQAAGAYTRVNWPLSVACTGGTVLVSPAGSSFPHETTVTLTVQPDAGRWFDRWTGNVPAGWERVNPLVLTMDAAKTLTANLSSGPLPAAPVLASFKINNGAANAVNPTVILASACTAETSGSAAQFLASESPDFTGAAWRPYRSLAMFRVSEGGGVKTVYFKVKNSADVESAVTSGTITLAGSDLALVAWGTDAQGQCALPAAGSGFVEVAAGEKHNLGLKVDGTVVAWGDNYYNQCRISAPNRSFVSVSAGRYHSLGLTKDGSIAAWGYNSAKQCTVPSPNRDFVAIAGGGSHSLGLKADGSIVAWGDNYFGQCTVPSPNSGFVAIAAGISNSLALKADGSIVEWGYDDYDNWTIPLPNSGFVAIAAGFNHRLALKSDGTIVAWGDNGKGQCNVASPNSGFVAVTAGYYHSLGLKADGSIVAWGNNAQGQGTVPTPNHGYVAFIAGGNHSLALAPGGDLQMTLTPPEAIAAGARWRLADEAANVWHDDTVYDPVSNTSSTVLRARTGFHSLVFKDLYGWTKPQDGEVELTTGGLTRAAGHYDPILRNLATQCEGKGKILAVPAAFTGAQYVLGTTVTLTAQPDAGWRFSGWTLSGPAPVPTTNPFQLVMLADTVVTAHFTQVFTLTTSIEGQGTLQQNPSNTQVFDAGSTVTLTATPAAGYVFAGWSGGVAPEQKAQNPLVLVMDRNWNLTVGFLPEGQSSATLSVATEGQGTVRANPDLLFYPVGSTVTLTAVPGKGQKFVRWEGDVPAGSETTPTLTLTMSANRTVRAVFERIPSLPVWMISRADAEDLGENSLNRSVCRVETQIERDLPWRGQVATPKWEPFEKRTSGSHGSAENDILRI